MRLDLYLVKTGAFESRSKAAAAISDGRVSVNGTACVKASFGVKDDDSIEIIPCVSDGYVGRAAIKLEYALQNFKISVDGLSAVDIGASTGGFTQTLLKYGAKTVYAVDVGRGQLHEALLHDSRVVSIEGFNAREMTLDTVGGKAVDIAVMDVSFISQTLLYDAVRRVVKDGGMLISLIKPQFELTKSELGKNGIVKSEEKRRKAIDRVLSSAADLGFECNGVIKSPIEGGSGNTEYLAMFIL